MSKISIAEVVKKTKDSINKHSPEILIGVGISCLLMTTVTAVKATPKALELIDEKKIELKVKRLPAKELVKATWKCYIPSASLALVSTSCIIGSRSISAKRSAALATAYKLSESAFETYKEKVIETIGEKKEKNIREKIDKDHVDNNPVSKNEIIITKKGDTLCYDVLSGRYFKSDIDKIKKAENILNKRVLTFDYASLNEFYDEIGLRRTTQGDQLGWTVNEDQLDIFFSSQLADDGTPCVVINYNVEPKYGYSMYE